MLSTRFENWKLRRQRQAVLKSRDRALKGLKGGQLDSAWTEWRGTEGFNLDIIDATIQENISRDLIQQAQKLHVPTSGVGGKNKWMEQEEFGDAYHFRHWRVLSPEAFSELRTAIREEKRQRRKTWAFWVKLAGIIITALTGLIGAAIGLVSVLKK